ncbi:thioredoxin-like protein [Epithele typhae]|uniref:thioredoxin-like protein n=1 Tax=Epithele typhae TaxID=378194 RepID=UPI00200804E6|nr:thioredoxin-like protein [Epithele typhae]KAH9914154.1 thioredoxin-like protein [Epithele typhae]
MSEVKRMTLYAAHDTPFPHRVRLALAEANVEYDTIWIDLIDKPKWYEKKVYPTARVPMLVYGGGPLGPDEAPAADAVKIGESLAINEFLADLLPDAHLLPADPVARAHARLFARAVDEQFLPAFFKFLFLGAPVEPLLDAFEGMQALLGGAYAVGDAWSIADAAFVPLLARLDNACRGAKPMGEENAKAIIEALESERFKKLKGYKERNYARPSFVQTWDEVAVHENFMRRLDRFRKTGKINMDLTIPLPPKQN